MKRVIIFSYDFPPNTGGISRLTEQITLSLFNQYGSIGCFIEVLTISNSDRVFSCPGIKITTVSRTLKGRTLEAYQYLSSIKDKDDTIVICGLWWPEGFVAEIAGIRNTFILTHAAEIRPDKTWFRKKIWIPFMAAKVLSKAKAVIANSAFTAQLTAELSPKAIVHCLPLAVNHILFSPDKKTVRPDGLFHLLTVTRIQLWKGLDTILEAISSLPKDLRDKVVWNIAGKGPDTGIFRDMVKKSVIAGQVNMLGFVPDEDLPCLYADSDLFVLCTRADQKSSNIEGFGLVFLESQASGTPVIGSCFGGISSAIEEGNGGWMVRDKTELTNLLKSLMVNRQYILEQGRAARKRVEQSCTWLHYTDQLVKIIGL